MKCDFYGCFFAVQTVLALIPVITGVQDIIAMMDVNVFLLGSSFFCAFSCCKAIG